MQGKAMDEVVNMFEQGETQALSRGSNQSGMRAHNERLVLTLIRKAGAMAKADIARQTGLSAQTASVIIRLLEADGLLTKGKPVRGKIGQPSVPMSLAKDGAFFFGLKVGRRSLDLVLTDFLGAVIHRERVTHTFPTPQACVDFARDAIDRILALLPDHHRSRVAGLGLALPFQLWNWADALGIDAVQLEDWQHRDIAQEIAALVDFPVFICNDASSACGAELVFGAPDRPRDFLYVFVGFFIGGGLVLDGALYTGRTGNAAALGSMTIPGPDGKMRQLVDVASLATLEKALIEQGFTGAMNWDDPTRWSIPSESLDEWLTEAAAAIAHAILSSVCLIDAADVLVDGWMPVAMRAELVRRIGWHVNDLCAPGIAAPRVAEGSVGADARVLGAASLPLSQRFLVERNTFLKGQTP
jgi:predicted NBD/HSP70 family sugar kinase